MLPRPAVLWRLLVLLLGGLAAACHSATPDDDAAAPPAPPAADRYVQGDLTARIEAIQDDMPRRGSDGFVMPSAADLERWRAVLDALLAEDTTTVDALLAEHLPSYALIRFTEAGTGKQYYLLQEAPAVETGWGSVVVNPAPERDLAIQAPHPVFDLNTHRQAVDIFEQTGARVLLLAGTHRCANRAASPCDGTTSVCGGGRYRVSDMAHVVEAPFQVTHAAVTARFPDIVSISLHGNGRDDCETVFLSSGPPETSHPSLRTLQRALQQRGVRAGTPETSSCPLVGSTNVQGRLTNGAPRPCTEAAATATGRFIHVEQRRAFREEPTAYARLIEALNATF